MSRSFDDGASQNLTVDSTPASTNPMTLACWFYSDDVAADQVLMYVGDKDVNNQSQNIIVAAGQFGGDPIQASSYGPAGAPSTASSATGFSANTWHHACGVFAGDADRRAYIDGGGEGTNTGSEIPGASFDRVAIGGQMDSFPGRYMSGRVGEAAMWDVALTASEIAILGNGFSPLFVRPQNLEAYWSFIRDEDQDRVGGRDMTANNGPTIASHPPIIYPSPALYSIPSIVVGAQTIIASAIASLEAFGSPQINLNIQPSAIASLEAFGTPQINLNIQPSAIASLEAFGAPVVSVLNTILPGAIASLETFGTPKTIYTIFPSSIASLEAFGTPQLNFIIFPSGIASAETFGSAIVNAQNDILGAGGILTAEAFGTPQINFTVRPLGIASDELFGTATIFNVDQFIICTGIASEEAFGLPNVIGGIGGGSIIIMITLESARVKRSLGWTGQMRM